MLTTPGMAFSAMSAKEVSTRAEAESIETKRLKSSSEAVAIDIRTVFDMEF